MKNYLHGGPVCGPKNFKIRRIIEYPDTEEEGEGGKE
jgi:hypothetical protein